MYEKSTIIDAAQYCKWDREYLECLNEAKITAIGVNTGFHASTQELFASFDRWDALLEKNKDLIMRISKASDIKLAKKEKKTGIYLNLQNPKLFCDDLSLLGKIKKRGVLLTQLVLEIDSRFGGCCLEENERGLNEAGKKAIDAINEVNMLCDISFASNKCALEAMEYSKKPLCMSHALPAFFSPHPRNKSDEVLKTLSRSGGCIALSLFPPLLHKKSECLLHEFCEMVARLVDMIGLDVVAIGSDLYEGQSDQALRYVSFNKGGELSSTWPSPLEWFDLERGMYVLYESLFRVGFFEGEIKAILGENWFKFMKDNLA